MRQAFEIRDLARFGDLEELCLKTCPRPAVLLQLALNGATDVEAPDGLARREAQGLERDGEFRAPPIVGSRGSHDPDAVPVVVRLTVRKHQAVDHGAGRIGREVERVALVAERVEHDAQPVIGVQTRVPRHLRRQDAAGLRVVTHDADVEVVLVVEQRDFSPLRGHCAGHRDSLDQIANLRRLPPRRLVQRPIDDNLRADRRYDGRSDRVRRAGLLGSGDAQGGPDDAVPGADRRQRTDPERRIPRNREAVQDCLHRLSTHGSGQVAAGCAASDDDGIVVLGASVVCVSTILRRGLLVR